MTSAEIALVTERPLPLQVADETLGGDYPLDSFYDNFGLRTRKIRSEFLGLPTTKDEIDFGYMHGLSDLLEDGPTSALPLTEKDVLATMGAEHQITALRGLARRQELAGQIATFDTQKLQFERDAFRQRSEHSPFGRLLNKPAFEDRARTIIDADRREQTSQPTSKIIVFADVDGLNKLNSLLSEPLVDEEVLRPIIRLLASHSRKDDLTSHWGGDEFAKLLIGITADQARTFLNTLRDRINGIKLDASTFNLQEDLTIGMCFGYALARPGETYANVTMRAARAKEFAKEQPGKNYVADFEDIPEGWVPTRKYRVS